MQIEDWSFLAVVVTILLTPGPTNTLLAAAGAGVGWRRGVRLIPMETLGYWLATTVWGLLLAHRLSDFPLLLNAIKLISATMATFIRPTDWKIFSKARSAMLTSENRNTMVE